MHRSKRTPGRTHLAEYGRGETSDDTAPEVDGELGRARERRALLESVIERNATSWQNSFTVNWPIAYGICLSRRTRRVRR